MRFLAAAAAIAVVDAKLVKFSPDNASDYIMGLLKESLGKNDLPEIKTCIHDQTGITNELQVIINEVKQGFSIQIALDVAHRIGVLISELPGDLRDCVSLNDDMAKITAWTSGLVNDPKRVFANIVKNWNDLGDRFKDLPVEFKKGAFEKAGRQTADILIDMLGKISDAKGTVVVEHNTPYGTWGHFVGQHNDFMPITHTAWDGLEIDHDGAVHGHLHWGDQYLHGEPELEAEEEDAHVEDQYVLGRENVAEGEEELDVALADAEQAADVDYDFANEEDDYLNHELYHQAELDDNAIHFAEDNMMDFLY